MNKDQDNPDTFVMDEQSEWQSTQVDDVFLPSVQVLIRWSDVEAAVESVLASGNPSESVP